VDVLAVGGYGRGEMCPGSDWDVWFVLTEDASEAVRGGIERFVYAAWDMNVKLGHAVRTVEDSMSAVREDWNTATAALEARLLHGPGTAHAAFQQKLDAFFARRRKAFVEAKLAEMEARQARAGDTAFLMEPDVKEGKGGLRDVQSVFWMAKVWHGSRRIADLVRQGAISETEYRHLSGARAFLWRCRTGLHLLSRRVSDRLSFERQMQLAERMGYENEGGRHAVEFFMQDYFRHAGRIARVSGLLAMHFQQELHPQWLTRRKEIGDGFTLEGIWIGVRDTHVFEEEPLRLLRIFHVAQEGRRRLSADALRLTREHVLLIDDDFRASAEACDVFLRILRHPRNVATTLKQMNDTGVLGRFIPDFRHAVGLGQFNNYHAYTVDEHTLRAIGEARNFAHGLHETRLDLAHEVFPKVTRPELLYLALLFHDIAKGKGGDHSELGEEIARRECLRLGLNRDAAELVAWLVRHHLLMAMTSQRSDLTDAAVIERFARQVGDLERLRYLLLLTVADIAAVGPNVWNGWKGALLRDLYLAAERWLMGEEDASASSRERAKLRIESTVQQAAADERQRLAAVLEGLPWRAVLGLPPRHLLPVARMLAAGKAPAVEVRVDEEREENLVLALAVDRPGLFADIARAMASGHINILAAQAFSLRGGQVLDVFHIQSRDGAPLFDGGDVERLKRRLLEAIEGGASLRARPARRHVLMERVKVMARPLPLASSRQTAIEVTAADRPGLLGLLAGAITQAGFNLRGASVSTFGERAVDVFFLTRPDGRVLSTEETERMCGVLERLATLPDDDRTGGGS